jgi:DNA-binding NarL/FixJ family response regulator
MTEEAPGPIRLLIADDQPLQRAGWRLAFDAQPDIEVVAEAADGVQAMSVLRRTSVDVALLNVRLPRLSGLEVAKRVPEDSRIRLTQRPPVTRVMLVTAFDLHRYQRLGRELGADAVLYTDTEPSVLFAEVRAAAALRRATAGT